MWRLKVGLSRWECLSWLVTVVVGLCLSSTLTYIIVYLEPHAAADEAQALFPQDLRGTHDTIAQEDFLGAAALLGLSSGGAGAHTPCYAQQAEAEPLVLLPSSKPGRWNVAGGVLLLQAARRHALSDATYDSSHFFISAPAVLLGFLRHTAESVVPFTIYC